jgi:hypothetical protein
MNSWINLTALWQIVVVGLIAGAGLPALFAVGLLALNMPGRRVQTARAGAAGGEDSGRVVGGSVPGMIIGAVCFLIVLSAIGWGIYAIYQAGHPK